MLLKVCGMTQAQQIEQLDRKDLADLIGMIFYPGSPRYVSEPIFKPPNALSVGVFVNASFDEIMHKAITCQLDYVQLHGDESTELCQALKAHLKVIKAFRVQDSLDIELINSYEGLCDLFLFDTMTDSYGGSGKRFNWELLHSYGGSTPFLLSGGITPESAEKLLEFRHPQLAGYDINSRFEIEPGIKNINEIERFKHQLFHENTLPTR